MSKAGSWRWGRIGFVLVLAGALGALVVWLVGGSLIAAAPRIIGPLPHDLHGQDISFPSQSGEMCRGWFLAGRPGHGAVLLLHGVRGSRLDMLDRARFLQRDGHAVLLFDFPGHGASEGKQISFGFYEAGAVIPALQRLHELAPDERVGVIGSSMGAAAWVMAHPHGYADAVILEAMYPTLTQAISHRLELRLGTWGRWLTPLLTIQLKPRLGFDAAELRPIDQVAMIDVPLLIMAGDQDRRTPLEESRQIFAHAREPKAFWSVPGADHVDLHEFATETYEQHALAFFHRHLRGVR